MATHNTDGGKILAWIMLFFMIPFTIMVLWSGVLNPKPRQPIEVTETQDIGKIKKFKLLRFQKAPLFHRMVEIKTENSTLVIPLPKHLVVKTGANVVKDTLSDGRIKYTISQD